MKVFILISLAFSISMMGCSSAPTKSILEERAGYAVKGPPLGSVGVSNDMRYVPTRIPEKVVVAWLFPHPMPSKVYFWGSWLSVVYEEESWEMVKVDIPKSDKSKQKRTPSKPKTTPPKTSKPKINAAA